MAVDCVVLELSPPRDQKDKTTTYLRSDLRSVCYAAVRPLISAVSGVQFPPEVMKVDPGRLKTLSFTINLLLVKPKTQMRSPRHALTEL